MSGLVKAKEYDWRDSNLALFGSDTEKSVKKESAQTEPAWHGAGSKVGLQIWRIVKFKVTDWPKADYGKFFSGDSYIVLHTYKQDPNNAELSYDLHFWIGSKSTQDEYGTVAYKTVELDTLLDDKAVQYREVQGVESERFHSYFKAITIMEGGAESGFRHVTPEEYRPRLLQFCGTRKHIAITEVPLAKSRLNAGDVFILDLGLTLYQWNGSGSNKDERFRAAQYLQELQSERGNAATETFDEGEISSGHRFFESLTAEDRPDDISDRGEKDVRDLFRVNEDSGKVNVSKVKDGHIGRGDFNSGDVFIFDTGIQCFVWIGSGASPNEKKNGMGYATTHLNKTNHKLIPIIVIKEGQHSDLFDTALAA